MEEQANNRILMFCAPFFGYDKRILDALKKNGYQVDLYDEKPGASFMHKACIRYNVGIYRPVIRKYIQSVISDNADARYNYVLVVKGEAINSEAIELLRKAYPKAKFILYLWDSVMNIPKCERHMVLYDRVLTFDSVDASRYNISYLPIPYGEEYTTCSQTDRYNYDVAFIGTAHSVRPRVINQIKQACEQAGRKCFVYFYCPHILVYLFNKLTNKDFRWIKWKDVHFESLTQQEVCDIYGTSCCILDVEHPRQQGTTTRPVEMMAMKKKIITTNKAVKDFPFYSPNNFLIIDRNNPCINVEFIDWPYQHIDDSIVERYCPTHFVKELIG